MSGPEAPRAEAFKPEWLRRKERGSQLGIRAFVWLSLHLGRRVVRLFLPPICVYFLMFSPASRRASRDYLSRVLERRPSLRDVYRHYHAFASCVLDRVFFLSNRTELFDVEIHGEHIVTDVLARGSGCILLGAHIGSFEALRAVGRGHRDLRVNMLMFEDNARKVNAVLNAIDPALAKDIISLGRADSFVTVQRCLEQGHFVGVLADRSLSDERQVTHEFLGAPARFSVNPFRMTTILAMPVVFMVALYRGGARYEVHFENFAGAQVLSSRASAADIDAMVGRYVARLEHYCRSAPYNWFNFYDVWR